jgi:hypothetical protein
LLQYHFVQALLRKMPDQTPLTLHQVTDTVAYVESLDFDAKLKRFDRIFEVQPAVLGAVVQLKALGVDSATQDHAFHVLLVLFECFTRNVPNLPRISEEMVQKALDNNVAMVEFFNEERRPEAERLQRLGIENYPDQNVLAFVAGYLDEQGLTRQSRENVLVVHVCKSIMDAFFEARQIAGQVAR